MASDFALFPKISMTSLACLADQNYLSSGHEKLILVKKKEEEEPGK